MQAFRNLAARAPKATAKSVSSRCASTLKEVLAAQIPEKQASLLKLKKEHGDVGLGMVTIDQVIGGSRGIKTMMWETSNLDPEEGIRFRGLTIPDCQKKLPGYQKGGEPTPEALIWLLLTSEVPTKEQADMLTADLHARSKLPAHIEPLIRSFPKDMHPMTQFAAAVAAMQTDSKFAVAYHTVNKKELWQHAYEDILNVFARLPEIAALIYRCRYADGQVKKDLSLDYSGNFCRMLGFTDPTFDELMRLYMVIHSDHEGGNASAHATHLVGSTLSDPYLSYAAGLCALAGPLHGLANQEVLGWILQLQAEFKKAGKPVNKDTIEEFTLATLNSGKVIPGYGHAVLRKTDPRYEAQRQFALKHLPDDPLFHIVSTVYEVVPGVLTKLGKVKNPWPNVDAHSGVLLCHYGFTQHDYYTVLFGVSRAMGALSQLFWDRALGLPLERPKSVTPEFLWSQATKAK
ncbi:citrate synthase-like protein [Tribonema minus]|uniref:Citrate synthase n=1 Tax=Tribonema minus TaxID=303371 RepID=A0A835YLV9_9STRA|nr:citrate synthase-like protein [Tribonema minus]